MFSVFDHLGPGKIDPAPCQFHCRVFRLIIAPQDDTDAQQQFLWQKWLDHIIVRPEPKPADPVLVLSPRGQEEHGDLCKFPHLFKQGKAIPVRQHDVKDCKLRSPFFCCPERVFDGARCPYLCISVPAEKICYHVKDLLLIIHEKDLFLFQIILLHHPSLLLLIIAQKSLLSFLFP